jgi:lysozyme family protein
MASFPACFEWLMQNEDAAHSYATVPDVGGDAISGINSASFPSQFKAINALPQSQRGPAVEDFYFREFWNAWYAALNSDDLAMRVFDCAVNQGPGTAVRLLQEAVGACGDPIAVDGEWGPLTVNAANAIDPAFLLAGFQARRAALYQEIVGRNPQDAKYLKAWLARAAK